MTSSTEYWTSGSTEINISKSKEAMASEIISNFVFLVAYHFVQL